MKIYCIQSGLRLAVWIEDGSSGRIFNKTEIDFSDPAVAVTAVSGLLRDLSYEYLEDGEKVLDDFELIQQPDKIEELSDDSGRQPCRELRAIDTTAGSGDGC